MTIRIPMLSARLALAVLLGSVCGSFSLVLTADEITFTGEAFGLKSGNLLYRETHQLILNDGRPVSGLVEYVDTEGELIARKTNRYHALPATTDFDLQDSRSDYREQAILNQEDWTLSRTENGQTERNTPGKPKYQAVVDAGFDEFVRQHWDTLLAGDTVPFSFAVPARLDWIDFRLIPRKVTDTTLTVEMKLKSRMLAWLLDPIRLTYDRDTRRLLTYRGLTNIRDANGEGIHAEIRYHYD